MMTHKFQSFDFGNGILTKNGCLHSPNPIALFIGTFNPDLPNEKENPADFFYGRNYFWPVWAHIFFPQDNFGSMGMRRYKGNMNRLPLHGNTYSIMSLCKQGNMAFADLIAASHTPHIDFKDSGLHDAAQEGLIDWNTANIIDYLNATPTIEHVIFTRDMDAQGFEHFAEQKRQIKEKVRHAANLTFSRIHTPAGTGLPGTPRCHHLAQTWRHQLPLKYLKDIGVTQS